MIKLSRLPPDTKVISDEDPSGLYDAEDLERPDFDKSGLRFFVANKVKQQRLSRCDVKYLFDIGEERDGYDGQAQDCIDSIPNKDMNIILGILNHAIVRCPAYTGGEEIDVSEGEI
jgi:hypothetical protein